MSLISLEDALARILGRVQPLQGEVVPIGSAEGRILQEDLFARVDLPGSIPPWMAMPFVRAIWSGRVQRIQ